MRRSLSHPLAGERCKRKSTCVDLVNVAAPLARAASQARAVLFVRAASQVEERRKNMEPVIVITHEPLDRAALIEAVAHASVGGIVVFEGVVRDNARGKQVCYLEYDVYPEMAIAKIREIVAEAERRWGVERVAVAHRVGRLEIGEASVIVVVATPHRGEAFDACRYIIDTLKTTVPIWKKEVAPDGEEWVEG